jgi:hypothetical protein
MSNLNIFKFSGIQAVAVGRRCHRKILTPTKESQIPRAATVEDPEDF